MTTQHTTIPLITPNNWTKFCNSNEGLSVVTFNTLRKGYDFTDKNWVTEEEKSWDFRFQLHEKLLTSLNADIICLQEAEVDSVEEDFAFMKDLGYGLLKGCTRNPKDEHTHTKPSIFFKSDKFTLKWSNQRSRILLSFFEDQFGHTFYVIGCHLQSGKKHDQKCFQMKSALQQLQTHAKSLDIPEESICAIVCGDFNSTPHQFVHNLLRNGSLTEDESTQCFGKPSFNFEHSFVFEDAYSTIKNRPCTFKYGTDSNSSSDVIDFIYFTPNMMEVLAVRDPLTKEQKRWMKDCGLPNSWNPSDHLPQAGLFRFK